VHELQSHQISLDGKRSDITSLKEEIQTAKYDDKIRSKTAQIQQLESQKDSLSLEFRSLSGSAETRAKLDLNRASCKAKEAEVGTVSVASLLYVPPNSIVS
jgi:hypothetical protein